jgi:WD40 repeat protein
MKTLSLSAILLFSGLMLNAQPDPYLLKDFKKVSSQALCVSFTPDGKSVLAGYNDGNARIINIETGECSQPFGEHWKGVRAVEMSHDGKFIFTAGDNTLKGWTPELTQIYVNKDMTTTVNTADLDSTGKFIVAGEFNKTFHLFDAAKGEKISDFRGHTDVAMTVCFNHDGTKIASASGNGNIRIWDRVTQTILAQLKGQVQDIYSLAFSNDGRYLASASKDKTINIYDLETLKTIQVLKGHQNQVMDVEFSNDGQHLISASFDQSIRLWEVKTGKCLYSFIDHKDAVIDVEFSPDGKTFASASYDNSVKVWNFSHEIMVDYYYSPEVIGEMQDKLFLPKQKGESKDVYTARTQQAAEKKKEIYERFYQKYLNDLNAGTLPTL